MKKLIAIALMVMASVSFGSQSPRVLDYAQKESESLARKRHRERMGELRAFNYTETKRTRTESVRATVEANKKLCPIGITPYGAYRVIHPSQCGMGIGELQCDEDNKAKNKKTKKSNRLISNDSRWEKRRSNVRKFNSSGPARRRR